MALIGHASCGYLLVLEDSIGAWYTLSVILWCSWLASVKEKVKRICSKLCKLLLVCIESRGERGRGKILTAAPVEMEYSKRKEYGDLRGWTLAHPSSSSTRIFSVQKTFFPLPPSLSSVPLPSSLHKMDLENGHIGIFPRTQHKVCGSQLFLGAAIRVHQSFCTHSHLVEYSPIHLKTVLLGILIKQQQNVTQMPFFHSFGRDAR